MCQQSEVAAQWELDSASHYILKPGAQQEIYCPTLEVYDFHILSTCHSSLK